ncbi:hypothetical protein NQ318_015159 [Aromia moschata]|uniref:Protein TIC 20 n=1 Tax=Aromia moschata TaxID=1265417 RepID=A0AAV8X8D8_9CUCU|nr:hypothetical protein NQ318_015159 [Aromia moschata]
MANSVIFIGSPDHNKKPLTCSGNFRQLFVVHPADLALRIFKSFIPPFNKKYQKVYVDLSGPLLAVIFVNRFGNLRKFFQAVQSVLTPLFYFFISRLGQSNISLYETTSLVGYALYGHLLTLLVSYVCFQEESNFFFSLMLVFLGTIPRPAVRLLICTAISLINLLSLIFLHFAYMHRTFAYKNAG